MDTAEDKLVALIPCKLFDACLRALSRADAKVWEGSFRTYSIIVDGNNPFSKTAFISPSKQKIRVIYSMGRCVVILLAFG